MRKNWVSTLTRCSHKCRLTVKASAESFTRTPNIQTKWISKKWMATLQTALQWVSPTTRTFKMLSRMSQLKLIRKSRDFLTREFKYNMTWTCFRRSSLIIKRMSRSHYFILINLQLIIPYFFVILGKDSWWMWRIS